MYKEILSCICKNLILVTNSEVKKRSLFDLLKKLSFFENFIWVTSFLFVILLLCKVSNACNTTKLNIKALLIVIYLTYHDL